MERAGVHDRFLFCVLYTIKAIEAKIKLFKLRVGCAAAGLSQKKKKKSRFILESRLIRQQIQLKDVRQHGTLL